MSFSSIYFTITEAKNIARFTEDFFIIICCGSVLNLSLACFTFISVLFYTHYHKLLYTKTKEKEN